MADDYNLVPAELPGKVGRKRATVYQDIIDEFVNGENAVVRVDLPGKKLSTIALQLRRTVNAKGVDVSVVQREDHIYLVRK